MSDQGTGVGGSAGAQGGPRARLRSWVQEWARLDDSIKAIAQWLGQPAAERGPQPDGVENVQEWREERSELADDIFSFLKRRPKLADEAAKWGFTHGEFNLDDYGAGGQTPDGAQGSDGSPTPTGDGKSGSDKGGKGGSGGKGGGGGGGGNDGPDRDMLPGVRGKDYIVVNEGGTYWAVFTEKIPGSSIKFRYRYRLDEKDLKNGVYGFGTEVAVTWGKDRLRSIENWGQASEIVRGKAGNRSPFKQFLRLLAEQHPGASWLKNRKVVGYMLQAHVENRGSEWLDNMLRTTKWWNNRTDTEREWELRMGDAEKKKRLADTRSVMTGMFDELFGPVAWKDQFKNLDKMIENVASGRVSQAAVLLRAQRKAEAIVGTTAWAQKQNVAQAANAEVNEPEEKFAQLRAEAIDWLGYGGRPANDVLRRWSEELVAGTKSQADWERQVRTWKEQLYKYLDPDEKFMDAAASYKNIAEGILGKNLSYEDRLLKDFADQAKDGKRDPSQRMSFAAYEDLVRRDKRFASSETARNTVDKAVSFFDNFFNGTAYPQGEMF